MCEVGGGEAVGASRARRRACGRARALAGVPHYCAHAYMIESRPCRRSGPRPHTPSHTRRLPGRAQQCKQGQRQPVGRMPHKPILICSCTRAARGTQFGYSTDALTPRRSTSTPCPKLEGKSQFILTGLFIVFIGTLCARPASWAERGSTIKSPRGGPKYEYEYEQEEWPGRRQSQSPIQRPAGGP